MTRGQAEEEAASSLDLRFSYLASWIHQMELPVGEAVVFDQLSLSSIQARQLIGSLNHLAGEDNHQSMQAEKHRIRRSRVPRYQYRGSLNASGKLVIIRSQTNP